MHRHWHQVSGHWIGAQAHARRVAQVEYRRQMDEARCIGRYVVSIAQPWFERSTARLRSRTDKFGEPGCVVARRYWLRQVLGRPTRAKYQETVPASRPESRACSRSSLCARIVDPTECAGQKNQSPRPADQFWHASLEVRPHRQLVDGRGEDAGGHSPATTSSIA